MKKLVNRSFVFKTVGVVLFMAALVFNFNVSKQVSAPTSNSLTSVMLTASAQSEEQKKLAKKNPSIFDCYCVVDDCVKCACGC